MAAGKPTTEIPVAIDADGKPLFDTFKQIEGQLKVITGQVAGIGKLANGSAADFKKSIETVTKQLADRMGQLRTMAAGANTAGGNIQNLNANKALAGATRSATEYAQSLKMARDGVEALKGKINDLNREVANQGRDGKGATVQQRDRLAMYEKQLAALKALGVQQEQNDRRMARTKGGDLTAELKALSDAQARLNTAALNPRRSNLTTEIREAQRAQDELTAAIQRTRTAQAGLLREGTRRQGALARREVQDLMGQGVGSRTIQSGMGFKREQAENALAGAQTPTQLASAREALSIAEKRLRIIDGIVRAEDQAAKRAADGAAAQQRAADARLATMQRADARTGLGASKEFQVGEAAKIREVIALEQARAANAANIARIRAQLQSADAATQRSLQEQLLIEKAIGAQLTKNANEIARETAARNKMNAQSAPAAAAKPGSILPAGGFPTVFARTAAYGAAGSVLFGMVAALRQGAQFALEFEDKLKTLQAIANATDTEMVKLKSSIEQVGYGSRYSLTELTEMATKLAQAGVSAGSMGMALQSVSQLATASGSTPDAAVDLITAALGSFQLQAEETPRIADMITTALNRTRLTVEQAALAIQYVGATAYEQNISLEQLLATTAALSQAGIRSGSTIGTGMRQFLVDLQNPSEKLSNALKDLGLTAADVNVTTRGLPAVLETLGKSGFGASQAYGALETRAAAFYLVAKNNTGLMTELQMQFTEQGAAAVAQERAMDSLAAQWQRFKNILGTGFAESMSGIMDGFKNLLRNISDNMVEARRIAESGSREKKLAKGISGIDDFGSLDSYVTDKLVKGIELGGNAVSNLDGGGALNEWAIKNYGGLGSWMVSTGTNAEKAASSMERLTTTMNKQGEQATMHEDKMRGLEHEIARLITQQDTLNSTQGAVSLETASMTSRFEGLGSMITGTTNTVEGLIGAMRRLRNEESGQLIEVLNGQIATANQQINQSGLALQNATTAVRADPAIMRGLNRSEQGALGNLNSQDRDTRIAAQSILRDAQTRWTREGYTAGVNALTPLLAASGNRAAAQGTINIARQRVGDLAFQGTAVGQRVNTALENASGKAASISSASPGDRQAILKEIETILLPVKSMLMKNISDFPNKSPNQVKALAEVQALWKGALASANPTTTSGSSASRVEKGRFITAGDILSIAQRVSPGISTTGSERRSREEQDWLFRHGKTKASADTSYHTRTDGVAKDLPGKWGPEQGRALAAQMNAAAKNEGLKIWYQWESGKGKNQGSGEHIHGQALKNQRVSPDGMAQGAAAAIKQDISTGKLGLGVKGDALQSAVRALGDATTEAAFAESTKAANAALEAWAKQVKDVSEEEIVSQGMLTNQAADRRREVDNQIAQKREELAAQIKRKAEKFQEETLATILKTLENSLNAAQLAFNEAMRPGEEKISGLQAQTEGFGLASNAGRVPDYVQALASRRTAVAQEEQMRMRSALLPTLMGSQQTALDKARSDLSTTDWSKLPDGKFDEATNKVNTLAAAVAGLTAEKTNLDLALNAGSLVPKNLTEGLQQAIEAFKLANNTGQSFTDMMVNNMGGAIDAAHEGFTKMFTDIMTGSQTVLGAFQGFVQGMIKYMIQLAAKAVALKIFDLLLSTLSSSFGGPKASGGSSGASQGFVGPAFNGAVNIGGTMYPGMMSGGSRGKGSGRVTNGSRTRDSVLTAVAKDEWVVNSRATQSVGHEFMAKLNSQGAAALDAMRGSPIIVPQAPQETNVYIVKEGTKPQIGKNDILLAVHEDILSGGETSKLIKHVSSTR